MNVYKHNKPFKLECGKRLRNVEIAYHTFGRLNERKDNVIWVCHALTANSNVLEWWKGLFGDGHLFNPAEHFIVCANILGSHYGSTSPLSTNPATGLPYYLSFPEFTVRDQASLHKILADYLGLPELKVLIGGSLGGQHAMEWAILEPERIKNLILIATNAKHSPWGIAFNESQRLAISSDRTFYAQSPDGGKKGLKAARSIALLSYRSYGTYAATQSEQDSDARSDFRACSYQNYQGEKLVNRFNAYSYWYLSKAMDSHNVGRNRGSLEAALSKIQARTLVVGISNDLLFPFEEQKFLSENIPGASLAELETIYGHDGFLVETTALADKINAFLNTAPKLSSLQIAG